MRWASYSCSVRQAKCHACQRTGHIAKVCRSKADSVKAYKVETERTDPEVSVFTVGTNSHILQSVRINGRARAMHFIMDTGSPITILILKEFRRLGFRENDIQPSSAVIKGVLGHELGVLGEYRTKVDVDGRMQPVKLIITREGLGLDALRALQIDIVLTTDAGKDATGGLPR